MGSFPALLSQYPPLVPEKHPTAEELFFSPWLMEALGFTDEQVKEMRAKNQGLVVEE